MSSMELFIVITALVASGAGGLILLISLAGKRAHLVRAFNIQQEMEATESKDQDDVTEVE